MSGSLSERIIYSTRALEMGELAAKKRKRSNYVEKKRKKTHPSNTSNSPPIQRSFIQPTPKSWQTLLSTFIYWSCWSLPVSAPMVIFLWLGHSSSYETCHSTVPSTLDGHLVTCLQPRPESWQTIREFLGFSQSVIDHANSFG